MGRVEEAFKCLFGDSSVDDKLALLPDPEIRDQWYDEKIRAWQTLQSALEGSITYPKAKFYKTPLEDLRLGNYDKKYMPIPPLIEDSLDNLTIDNFKRLKTTVRKTGQYIKRYSSNTLFSEYGYIEGELINTCIIEVFTATGTGVNVSLMRLPIKEQPNGYSIILFNHTGLNSQQVITERFNPGDFFMWSIYIYANTDAYVRLYFFFDDSLPFLDEDDMGSDDADAVASQQSIKAFVEDLVQTDEEVEAIITAELVEGQSIDNRIDTLIALINHNDLQNINAGDLYEHLTATQVAALHAAYTDSDVENVITAELAAGESIDNAIDALILEHKNIANAHHAAGHKYVWRTPEASSLDFYKEQLTNDTNWNDINLSSILPAGTIAADIYLYCLDNAAGSNISLRQNGQTGDYQIRFVCTSVSVKPAYFNGLIAVDGDRKIEIKCNPKPTDWSIININVVGWIVPV
ncbi:hypothetical protein ES702_05208 [subsurface metagenome]